MSSTPRHIFLYKALGWKAPEYAHVGLLQNAQGEKFSKRNEDLDLPSFEGKGIFPEALINYVALFGWSHKLGDDFLRMEDLIQNVPHHFWTNISPLLTRFSSASNSRRATLLSHQINSITYKKNMLSSMPKRTAGTLTQW